MKKIIFSAIAITSIALLSFGLMMPKNQPVLNHIAVSVSNLKTSTAFYREMIGIDTIPEPFHDGKHTWFKIGHASQLHLIENNAAPKQHDKNNHLCFSIESMDEFISRLEKHKIDWTNWAGTGKTPTTRVDGVKQIYLQDPDGYWIEINNDKLN